MARTSDEKLALMHKEYGEMPGVSCKTCPHLDAYCNADCTRIWHKCHMFGVTNGPGTDWRVGGTACGAFQISPEEARGMHLYGEVYRRVRGLKQKQPEPELEGQTSIFDAMG